MEKKITTVREPARDIPVRASADILIVGGGPAGLMAAQAAAGEGLKVMLIESRGYLGGNLTIGLPILGFLGQKGNQIIEGLPQRFIDRLQERGAASGHRPCKLHVSLTIIDPEESKTLAQQLMEEAGVEVLMYVFCTDVIREGNEVKGVVIESKAGREAILARTVIDCTGDADVAFRAGVECRKGDAEGGMQPPDADVLDARCRHTTPARRDRRAPGHLRHGHHACGVVPQREVHHRGASQPDRQGARGGDRPPGGPHDPYHGHVRGRNMGQHVACERRRPDRSRELHSWGNRSQEAGLPNPEIPASVRPGVRKRVDGSGGTVHGYPREPRNSREIRPHGRGYPGLPPLRRRRCRSQLSRSTCTIPKAGTARWNTAATATTSRTGCLCPQRSKTCSSQAAAPLSPTKRWPRHA